MLRVVIAKLGFGREFHDLGIAPRVLASIEQRIAGHPAQLIVIDLEDMLITPSFGRMVFVPLVERAQKARYGKGRWIVLANANPFVEEALDHSFQRSGLLALLSTEQRDVRLIGISENRVRQVFESLLKTGSATSAALARELEISLQAVNKWLGKLLDAGVVEREQVGKGSGRPFAYRLRTPELAGAGGL
jgi:DNA-binding transcriptional ArsR family regulator